MLKTHFLQTHHSRGDPQLLPSILLRCRPWPSGCPSPSLCELLLSLQVKN